MRQKTMKRWQMVTMLVLSLIMTVTMFLPAFRINGEAVSDMVESVSGGNYLADLAQDASIESLNEKIADYEVENGVKISKISPFRIMTHSFAGLFLGDGVREDDLQELETDEAFSAVQKSYGRLRLLLWLSYSLALVILIIIVLGFLLKWKKLIPLIISTIYGIAAAIIFGYLRFGLMGSLAKKAGDAFMSDALEGMGGFLSGLGKTVMAKMLSSFYSISFLTAFITALFIIAASIFCMILGKSEENEEKYDHLAASLYGEGQDDISKESITPVQRNEASPFSDASDSGASKIPPTEPVFTSGRTEPVKPQKIAAPVGQVRCTKGIVMGQGLMLPADKKVIVGKSVQRANLIINHQNISNVHCSIRYNAATNRYIVKDHSTNGTFANGARLQKEAALEYPAGTVLSLADGSNEITLG